LILVLRAGYGAGGTKSNDVSTNYRGLAFSIGGDHNLEKHITIPNILKKFNPKLFGQSYGIGPVDDWEHAQLNVAVGGAKAIDMPDQAKHLVHLMESHPDKINMQEDWKLIHIFIGANDACDYCGPESSNDGPSSPVNYKLYLEEAVRYLYENVPKAIVSIVSMMNIQLLSEIDKTSNFCKVLHQRTCNCDNPINKVDVAKLCRDYQRAAMEIQDSGLYESNDFTVVVQPLLQDIFQPKLTAGDKSDVSFFAPDCFHFSQYGHAIFAKFLWNNLMQAVGSKTTSYNLTDITVELQCPSENCPFIRTKNNSKNPC
uniref:Phospholipase B1, membrane-associated n=1 Tax=Syphacia muris TaxID=451379 RepID=A0A0N5ADC6_9BILA